MRRLASQGRQRTIEDASAMVETLIQIQTALEKAGVVFISADEHGGPGVRLRDVPPRSRGGRRR